jgi:hypothetical protein
VTTTVTPAKARIQGSICEKFISQKNVRN